MCNVNSIAQPSCLHWNMYRNRFSNRNRPNHMCTWSWCVTKSEQCMHSNLIKSFIGEWCRNARWRSPLQGVCAGHTRSARPSISGSFHWQSLLIYVIVCSIWLILQTCNFSHFKQEGVSISEADVHTGVYMGHKNIQNQNKFKERESVGIVFIDILC